MSEEKKEEQKPEERKPSGWGVSEDKYLVVNVDVTNIYEAIGVLRDAEQFLVDVIISRRAAMKAEQEKRRQMIQGNDPLGNGAKQDPNFFKKTFNK